MHRETTRPATREAGSPMSWPRARARFGPANTALSQAAKTSAHPAHRTPLPLSPAEREQLILQHLPLVRYELGDIVEPGRQPCRCGRAFPVIASITGRPSVVSHK